MRSYLFRADPKDPRSGPSKEANGWNARPLRALHVIGPAETAHGGPTTAVMGICSSLAARGLSVRLSCVAPTDLTLHIDPRVDTRAYRPNRLFRGQGSVLQLAHLVRDVRWAQVVHIHSLYLPHTLLTALLVRCYRRTLVVRPHGTLGYRQRSRSPRRKRLVDLIQAPLLQPAEWHFTSQRECLEASLGGRRPKGRIVPLGTDVPASSERQRSETRRDVLRILFLGRLAEKKQPLLLLEAFIRLRILLPAACELTFAGPDGGEAARLRKAVDRADLARVVHITGLVSYVDRWAVLDAHDVFVLPSTDENFGVAALEAMAAGLAVFATDQVDIAVQAATRDAAVVIEKMTPENLATAIADLVRDNQRLSAIASRARAFVEEHYTWAATARALEEWYALLVSSASCH